MPDVTTEPHFETAPPAGRIARPSSLSTPQIAEAKLSARPPRLKLRVQLTPAGILAIGALVTGVLVATSGVVWTATSVARHHPLLTRLRPR